MRVTRQLNGIYTKARRRLSMAVVMLQVPRRPYIPGISHLQKSFALRLISRRLLNLQTPYEFAEEYDFPSWGNFTYSSSPGTATNFSFESGSSINLRYRYLSQHALQDIVDSNFRGWGQQEPVFAFAHDFGSVSKASALYTIGSIQEPIIRYLTSSGITSLQPWWSQCYGDMFQMIAFHYNDITATQQLSAAFESQLKSDIDSYYSTNMAMVYSNSTPSPPYPYSNGSQGYASGTDPLDGQQYIFGLCSILSFHHTSVSMLMKILRSEHRLWISRPEQLLWYCNS